MIDIRFRWTAVMRETLRLYPTAPGRVASPLQDTTLDGGKFAVKKGDSILILVGPMQRDPSVWGKDVRAVFPPM